MTLFIIPILVGTFGWCLVWAITVIPFKWPYLADQWVGQIDLTKILPALSTNDQFEALKPVINENLDAFFRHKLSSKLPMISMFVGDKTIEELKAVFMEELALLFPLLIEQLSINLNKDMQQHWHQKFRKIVLQKITNATAPYRWVGFVLGAIWGTIITLMLTHF